MSIVEKCKHEWEVIINEYEKAQTQKDTAHINSWRIKGSFPEEAFFGKKIIILQCKKCGQLDKTIESV